MKKHPFNYVSNSPKSRLLGLLRVLVLGSVVIFSTPGCHKKDPSPDDSPACFNADKVRTALQKVRSYLAANQAAYRAGTLTNVWLYIDMVATQERMDYFINTIALGVGTRYTTDSGTEATLTVQTVLDYKNALCNEVDHVNGKL